MFCFGFYMSTLPSTPLSSEESLLAIANLAKEMKRVTLVQTRDVLLLTRLKKIAKCITSAHQELFDAEKEEQTNLLSVNWILDNFYLIRGSLEDIFHHLPKSYYRQLPKIKEMDRLPKVYILACQLIKNSDGKITEENILDFLINYQKIDYLKIGELWAFPLLLRFGLIESLNDLVLMARARQKDSEKAYYFGNTLLETYHKDKQALAKVFNALKLQFPHPSPHFSQELLDHLFDEEELLILVKEWLENIYQLNISEILSKDQVMEAAEQVSMANAITSLIFLSQMDFRSIFKKVCKIEEILNQENPNIFQHLSFKTSDLYLHAIEKLTRGSLLNEQEVAGTALILSQEGKDDLRKHVGYYLIDDGRRELEKKIEYKPSIFDQFRRVILDYPTCFYVGGLIFFTVLVTFLIYYFLELPQGYLSLFLPLSIIPISELVIQLQNTFYSIILKPCVLPTLKFKQGIPKNYKTLVVIPILLSSLESIAEHLKNLEIRYLANVDPLLKFSLFADFKDHIEKTSLDDDEFLQAAIEGINALNKKYGEGTFFLFSRSRVFTPSENAYIGKERKRGKLELLNRFLLKKEKENIVFAGDPEQLNEVRFVITLDADTELLKNEGFKLIETLSHPLNEAVYDPNLKKVTRGYTIIQPRVSTSLPSSNKTYFSKIFSGGIGTDPYTESVSDVYQDLFLEGSYLGKGIYDLKGFHEILDGYFPDEQLLSHDLIEGAYVRVGFASSIELLDDFPENYEMYTKREHRWIRGDWQIADWIFKFKDPLSFINRFKIFDNLRRSLIPPTLCALVIVAAFLQTNALFWLLIVTGIVFIPTCILIVFQLFNIKNEFILSSATIKNSFLKSLISLSLLPYEAYLSLDAILRAIYRRAISKKHLLQWSLNDKHSLNKKAFFTFLSLVSFTASFFLIIATLIHPEKLFILLPLLTLWMLAPLLVYLSGREIERRVSVTLKDQELLKSIARKTWRFFDDFVTEETNFLPPDNFQESYGQGVAYRTSPTNIGLYLLSIISAYDFGFLTHSQVFQRIADTMQTLFKMERYNGHLLNWYDIKTLQPLLPKYVSTVDSGNLLASFWTLDQAIPDLLFDEILPKKAFEGLKVTLDQIEEVSSDTREIIEKLEICLERSATLIDRTDELDEIVSLSSLLVEKFKENSEDLYFAKKCETESKAWQEISLRYLKFIKILQKLGNDGVKEAKECLESFEKEPLSLYSLGLDKHDQLEPLLYQFNDLNSSFSESRRLAKETVKKTEELTLQIHHFAEETNLRFLFNEMRKVFSIGYNVSDCRLDNSYYDLLASEARLSSFIAIARGDVSVEHWWMLGRNLNIVNGKKVLLSWGGTMFEYLMPLLLTKSYRNSLLDEACKAAVAVQIIYGKKRGIPWGISESAFSEVDAKKTYQYQSFGVPRLGLKRELDDLVVSPYSTGLALMVDSPSSIKNLKRLKHEMHSDIFGKYGFYESVDYTRQHGPQGIRGVVIHAYMAHHQGMIFISINNLLNNEIMQERFHSDPRVSAVQSLLYEKLSNEKQLTKDHTRYAPTARLKPVPLSQISRIETERSYYPKINLLSNGYYSVMLTNSGTGYSHFDQTEISRWTADYTSNELGSFVYIKDLQNGDYWSATFQPTRKTADSYSVHFTADKTEFKRRDHHIETTTEIVVSPEDNAEIRRMTFVNLSSLKRHLEVTSYLELSLSPHLNDRAHPLFNKMFIQTSVQAIPFGLISTRRLRSNEEKPLFAAHLFCSKESNDQILQYETDREKFIGKGRNLTNPIALENELTNTTGDVLDPIFSLRKQLVLNPGERVEVAFITLFATSDEKIRSLINVYANYHATTRAIELAWTYSNLQLRHLKIHQEDAKIFQKLGGKLMYPQKKYRAIGERLKKNSLNQSDLWSFGISGDVPIIAVTVGDIEDLIFVKEILVAHTFINMRGLKCDLVFLNEEATAYEQPLKSQIAKFIQAHLHHAEMDKGGQVFLLGIDQISKEHLNLILAVSKVVLVAARGSLKDQLVSSSEKRKEAPVLKQLKSDKEFISEELPFMELDLFNGFGGFSKGGDEYVIYLSKDKYTPAPWINVMSNPQFGMMVSDAGIGMSWFGNSQTNRLTPWSNDPLLDPIVDILYIRDNHLGKFWSATPSPIRENDPYRIRHGQGYSVFEHNSHGINQELTCFVPVDENGGVPLRIQILKLKNITDKKRELTLMDYSELVLGENREDSGFFVVTEFEDDVKALFAVNSYNKDYGTNVTFASCSLPIDSYTADRIEFIGRNRGTQNPLSLNREFLLKNTGTCLDPCFALQVNIEIKPGETKEVVFILGQAFDKMEAKRLIVLYQQIDQVNQALKLTKEWWNQFLRTISIETKELSVNYLINRWLPYQNLSCRIFARSAFYQSSGAFGYRDQLQDVMALLYAKPELAREQILKNAAHQFLEGDVQHWWHPKSGGGIRTRITDDLLWLTFVTAQYVRITKDISILNEKIPFLQGPILQEGEQELFFIPTITEEKATLLEHCRRAIHKGLTKGIHGIPLIGGGDWNDGMNRVGIEGKGESVWLGFFIVSVLNDFIELLNFSNASIDEMEYYKNESLKIIHAVETHAWDGNWYVRAYFDDGTPIGSAESFETKIDSLSQSWSVISGAGSEERTKLAMESVKKSLLKEKERLLLLLAEPFDKIPKDPGYIKGYPPGIRENGGQYTHGSLWVPLAFARLREGDQAFHLLQILNPIERTLNSEAVLKYRLEPYVIAADIYSNKSHLARGGWNWYTGSAAWLYRIWIEEILGLKIRGEQLSFEPVLPEDWKFFKMKYRYKETFYSITYDIKEKSDNYTLTLDGKPVLSKEISLQNDGQEHQILINNG